MSGHRQRIEVKQYDVTVLDTGKTHRITEAKARKLFGKDEWKEMKMGYGGHLVVSEVQNEQLTEEPMNKARFVSVFVDEAEPEVYPVQIFDQKVQLEVRREPLDELPGVYVVVMRGEVPVLLCLKEIGEAR